MPSVELSLASLPADSLVQVEREGFKAVLIRSGGRVFAYQDKCPHAFWPLSEGTLHNNVLECPGHGWEFDFQTGRCLNSPAYCLTPVAVTICGDSVILQWPDPEKQNVGSPCAQRKNSEKSHGEEFEQSLGKAQEAREEQKMQNRNAASGAAS